MDALNEMIKKSLDEIDAMAEEFSKSKATETEEDSISKAQNDEDLNAGDVSEDAPQPEDNPDDAPEEGGDDPDSSNEDTDEDSEGEEDSEEDEEVEKSLEGELKSNENVKKALEVSEFLNELVKGISNQLTVHNDGLAKSIDATNGSNEILAKSLLGITKSQRMIMESQSELQKSIKALNGRLKAIEEQPMVRKSVATKPNQVVQKSFEASAGNTVTQTNTLSKSQASAKLMQAYEGGNADIMSDILALEGTGSFETLSPQAKSILGM